MGKQKWSNFLNQFKQVKPEEYDMEWDNNSNNSELFIIFLKPNEERDQEAS